MHQDGGIAKQEKDAKPQNWEIMLPERLEGCSERFQIVLAPM
jgi:hypothetical protein